jgi:chromosomal replication initiator protein
MPRFDDSSWQRVLEVLKQRHALICRQWFHDDLEAGTLDGGLLKIQTRTPVQQTYLQRQCLEPFTEAAQEVTGQLVAVRFVCEAGEVETQAQATADQPTPRPGPVEPDPADFESALPPVPSAENNRPASAAVRPQGPHDPPTGPGVDLDRESMLLVPDNSFDHFITGPNNQLACAAAIAVANQPGTAYNPLFIHGGVGLGKTHLLQAICQSILTRNPRTRILYVSCDAFMNQFIACVTAGKMNEFRHHYRHVDLLVIDDIHFLANRERSQEEFFHTFNELYQSNRQIVLSSDAAPHEIPDLEERLVSRFGWGMVAPVTKPSYETRVAILKAKAALRGFEVPDDVIALIARRVDSNARELEGAIVNLQGHAQLMDRPVDLALARAALGEPPVPAHANRATLQHIVDAVTAYFNVKLSDLQSRRRYKSITEPRQVCMYLAKQRTRFSLAEIGGYFGGRDHTTVLHSIEVVTNRMEQEDGFAPQIDVLLEQIDRATAGVG